MKVIVGLGNPGSEYEGSRHNVGFAVVAGLADGLRIDLKAGRGDFNAGDGRVGRHKVRLVTPVTYMNLSGRAVVEALEAADATSDDLLVVCDCIDLPLGQLRMRPFGGDGGHRGLKSIIEELGTERFARLRLGVGRPGEGADVAGFVLDGFTDNEAGAAAAMIGEAVRAVRMMLTDGIERAMTTFNRRATSSDEPDLGEG